MLKLGRGGRLFLLSTAGIVLVAVPWLAGAAKGPAATSPLTLYDMQQLGLDLAPLPANALAPTLSLEQAELKAQGILGRDRSPDESYHGLLQDNGADRQVWVFVWAGGPQAPVGPARDNASPLTSAYSGVVLDDQTGDLVFWFQGGSQ